MIAHCVPNESVTATKRFAAVLTDPALPLLMRPFVFAEVGRVFEFLVAYWTFKGLFFTMRAAHVHCWNANKISMYTGFKFHTPIQRYGDMTY